MMPFRHFAGFRRTPYQWIIPMPIAQIQTYGAFVSKRTSGVVAALVDLNSTVSPFVKRVPSLANATEASWASVYYGLTVAQQLDQPVVGLENDCWDVVQQILFDKPITSEDYVKYYHYKIHRLGREFEWCGIRWIGEHKIGTQ